MATTGICVCICTYIYVCVYVYVYVYVYMYNTEHISHSLVLISCSFIKFFVAPSINIFLSINITIHTIFILSYHFVVEQLKPEVSKSNCSY